MIVLHLGLIEDLIEFQSLEEITGRPAFTRDIDPASTKLLKPIGIYKFRERVPCGLRSCHQLHLRGLVVLTAGGEEVNIGHLCGRTHFGEEFGVYANMVQRFMVRKSHVEVIRQLKAVAGRHLARIEELRMQEKGAVWIEQAMRNLRNVLPGDVHESLCNAARRGEVEVFEEVRVYGEEADIQREFGLRTSFGSGRAPRVRTEPRGRIEGAKVWHKEPQSALWSLEEDIRAVMALDPLTCNRKRLPWAADVATQAESRLAECEALVEAGRRFFTEENISRLRFLPRIFQSSRSALENVRLVTILPGSRKHRAA